MLNNYPKIIINSIKAIEGVYNKSKIVTKSFLSSEKNSLFFPQKEKNITLSNFQNGKEKKNGYLLEILFHGLNYSAKRIKLRRKPFLIDVHKSEIFVHQEKQGNIAKSRIYKRRLVFFSYDNNYLKKVENYIKKLKEPNTYTGKGLFSRNDKYKVKKVKKKKR